MVYEYCDEIKNSGINRSFPTSCGTFFEMGLDATYTAIKECNAILEEAGTIELEKFRTNTITEASASEIFKTVKAKIVEKAVEFWKKIKNVWAAIQKWFEEKLSKIKDKLLKRFETLELSSYKTSLEKMKPVDINLDLLKKADGLVKDLKKQSSYITNENPYTFIAKNANLKGASKIDNNEKAKKAIDEVLGNAISFDYSKIVEKKSDIVKALKDSVNSVNSDYREAKKAMDETIKEIKATEDGDDGKASLSLKLQIGFARQNLILYVQDKKKKEFMKLCSLVANVNLRCNSVTKESAAITFNKDFVNEAFSW